MSGEPDAKPVRAVALAYDEEQQSAPSVLAKGCGDVARRIQELAEVHDIPVRQDSDLVQLLSLCDVGEEIPFELYSAVAELLAYLYRLNGETEVA